MQSGSCSCHTQNNWYDLTGSAGTLRASSVCGAVCAGEIPGYGGNERRDSGAVSDQLASACRLYRSVQMLKEMATAGVGMAVVVTAVWVGMVAIASGVEKKAAKEAEVKGLER